MTIVPVFDRDLPTRLQSLLAIERRHPIHIRLVSQHILDFDINGNSIFKILRRLKTKKNANITLLLDRRIHEKSHIDIKAEIIKLEDVGINIHKIRNLHAKIVSVENNQEKCILVTSANLSKQGYHVSHEVGIYCHNDELGIFDSFKNYITRMIQSLP